jgi:hypothetical protein
VFVLEKMLDDDDLDMMGKRAAIPCGDNTDSSIIISFTRGKDGPASIAVYVDLACRLSFTFAVVAVVEVLSS